MVQELGDTAKIRNENNDLTCDLEFKTKGYFTGTYNAIGGKVTKGGKSCGDISGKWSEVMEYKNASVSRKRRNKDPSFRDPSIFHGIKLLPYPSTATNLSFIYFCESFRLGKPKLSSTLMTPKQFRSPSGQNLSKKKTNQDDFGQRLPKGSRRKIWIRLLNQRLLLKTLRELLLKKGKKKVKLGVLSTLLPRERNSYQRLKRFLKLLEIRKWSITFRNYKE